MVLGGGRKRSPEVTTRTPSGTFYGHGSWVVSKVFKERNQAFRKT